MRFVFVPARHLLFAFAVSVFIVHGHLGAAVLGWTTGGSPGVIQTANRDATNIQPLPFPLSGSSLGEIHFSHATEQWFWFDFRSIKRANIDGSNPQVLITDNNMATTSGDFAIDDANQRIYWVNSIGELKRMNFDGSNILTLRSDLVSPRAVEVDPINNRLFWTEYGAANAPVYMADLNGGGRTAIAWVSSLRAIMDMAADPVAKQLYWTAASSFRTEQVQRVGYALATPTTLLDQELGNLANMTLDLTAGKMLMVDSLSGTIYEANLDGSGLNTLLASPSPRPYHLTLLIPEPSSWLLCVACLGMLHRRSIAPRPR
jgi:hypothetical protein